MRGRRWLPFLSLGLALGVGSACGNKEAAREPTPVEDTGALDVAEAATDSNVGMPSACITSPTPKPFETGPCTVIKPPSPDALDEALSMVGLDRCTFGFDPKLVPASGWDLKDKRRMPDYEALILHPLRLPAYGREMAKWLDEAVASQNPVSRAIAAASARRGKPVTACPDPTWFEIDGKDETPLVTAILAEVAIDGGAIDADATKAAAAGVPLELQRALAPIVHAIAFASREAIAARATDDGKLLNSLNIVPSQIIGTRQISLTPAFLAALDAVDVARMSSAAVQLASVIEGAKLERFAKLETKTFEVDTPFGAIVVHGNGRDTYMPGNKAENAALVLDTGGDDEYRIAVGGASLQRAVSVSIDLAGKDLYAYVEKKVAADDVGTRLPSDAAGRGSTTFSRVARQGGAVLGIGLTFDLGSEGDTYRSLAVSQGTGVLGVGVLFDAGGDDTYEAETLSQGAAGWGIGLLLDRAGNDRYRGYNEMQGFGATLGFGALVDLAGNDDYYVNPGDPALDKGDPLYGSAQLPGKGNTSMAQGCGYGRRSDTTKEKIGFLGGYGVLRDAAGNDKYTASVFAQGCGFLGAGFFLEGGGNDEYEGLWYVQGSTAHLGVALFHEQAGDDNYNPTFPIAATSVGAGHDFSVTVHLDEGGNDLYNAPGLSLGSGHANGVGILVNVGGVDVFKARGTFTLGGAAAAEVYKSPRGAMPTYGVFVKAGGSASYVLDGVDAGRTGGTWSWAPENVPDAGPDASPPDAIFFDGAAKSVGIDRPAGSASIP